MYYFSSCTAFGSNTSLNISLTGSRIGLLSTFRFQKIESSCTQLLKMSSYMMSSLAIALSNYASWPPSWKLNVLLFFRGGNITFFIEIQYNQWSISSNIEQYCRLRIQACSYQRQINQYEYQSDIVGYIQLLSKYIQKYLAHLQKPSSKKAIIVSYILEVHLYLISFRLINLKIIKLTMIDQERRVKQSYLREQILQKNYDAEDFIHFLNSKLKVQSDIDKCSLKELQDVVQLFIKEKESIIVQKTEIVIPSHNSSSKKDVKSATIVFKEFNPPIIEQQFEMSFKCLRIIPKYTTQVVAKMKCQVSNPQRKYIGGIFGLGAQSFLEFQVKTTGSQTVGRRYSDFIWLRNTLKKFYPSAIIPPIPNKKASKRSTKHIQKRMRILNYFLNDCIKLPEILNCKYFEGFLSLKQQSKFQALKKEADNKTVFENLTSTETQTGLVNVSLTNKNVNYYNQIKRFVAKSEVLYKEVTRASKRFQAQRIDQVNQLYQMGNKFAELYQVGKQFQSSVKHESISNLNEMYIKLNNMMIEWGNNIRNEIDLLQVNFNTFFKYARQSYMGFNQYFQKLSQIEKNFLTIKSQLDTKKEKIFLLHDPNKWDIPKKDIAFIPKSSIHQRSQAFRIMLPKESVEVQKLKTNYSFYLSRLHENSSRYFEKQAAKFNQNFNEFAIKNKVNNQQLGESWNEMCFIFSEGNKAAKKVVQMQKLRQMGESSNIELEED